MAATKLNFPPITIPQATGLDPTTPAGKVDQSFQQWASRIVLALQMGSVDIPTSEVVTAAATTPSTSALALAAAAAQSPTGNANPVGPAGGDLSGSYPNPSVVRINGQIPGNIVTYNLADVLAAVGSIILGAAGGDLTGTYPNPTIAAGAVTDTKVAAANKDGLAATPSMRTLGTGAQQATAGNDSRLSDARVPTGAAGGDLTGTYPNPTLAAIGSAIGPIGDGTHVATVTIDAKGRVTGLTATPITGAPPSGSAGGDLTGTYPNPTIAALAVTDAKVAAANKDGVAATPSMRTLGTGAQQACAGNDSRLSDSRAPTGAAGGDLTGTYPNPTLGASGVSAGSYTNANITVDAKGRVTVATSGAAAGGDVVGPSSALNGNAVLFDGTTGKLIKDAGGPPILSGGNATLNLVVHTAVDTASTVSYATGGAVQMRFDLGNFAYIGLTVDIDFSPSGSNGLVNGRWQHLIIENTTGAPLNVTYPASWKVAGTIPPTIAVGQIIALFFEISGTAETDVGVAVVGTTGGSSGVTSITAGTGLSGGTITTTGTIALANTAVTPGSYTNANITIDAQGRITLAANGSGGGSIGVPTTGALNARLRKNISGTITGSGDMTWSGPDVFNVKDYGALGDGSTVDDTAIAAAIAALVAYSSGNTRGTLYFPDGTYLLSVEMNLTLSGTFTATVKGNGRLSSIILQSGSTANGLKVNLVTSAGQLKCAVEVCDLGFVNVNGTTTGTAIHITAGTGSVGSGEMNPIQNVRRVMVGGLEGASTGGWTDGIFIESLWSVFVQDALIAGCSAGNVVPTSGAGSGAGLKINGGQNVIVSDLKLSFWKTGIALNPAATSPSGQQGFFVSRCIFVAVQFGVYQTSGGFIAANSFTDLLFDMGNDPNNGLNNVGIFLDMAGSPSFTQPIISRCWFTIAGSTPDTASGSAAPNGCSCIILVTAIRGIISNCIVFASPQFIHLRSGCTENVVPANQMTNAGILIDSGANNNQFNNTGGSAWSDSGSGNSHITTLF